MKQEWDKIENNFMKNNSRDIFGKFTRRLTDYNGSRDLFIKDRERDLAINAEETSRILAVLL